MKRRQVRKALKQPVTLEDAVTGEVQGTVVDITTEGIMLRSAIAIKPDYVFQYNVILPKEIKGLKKLTIGLDCLWSRPDQKPGQYVSGFQIIDASPETITRLQEMIDHFSLDLAG
jgi:hypothetical protein